MPLISSQITHWGNTSRFGTCNGGVNAVVSFDNSLTIEELDYVRLAAQVDFFQLVRTAHYMNKGLTFREATIKYLTIKRSLK